MADYDDAKAALLAAIQIANGANLTIQQRRGLENTIRKGLGAAYQAKVRDEAEQAWAAVSKTIAAEVAKAEELADRLVVAKTVARLDEKSAEAKATKRKQRRTTMDLLYGPDARDQEELPDGKA